MDCPELYVWFALDLVLEQLLLSWQLDPFDVLRLKLKIDHCDERGMTSSSMLAASSFCILADESLGSSSKNLAFRASKLL